MKLNMNRREFLAAFGTIAASAVLAGCGGKTATTTGAPSDAASTPAPSGDDKSAASTMKLIVGFDSAYPPYGYVGDDQRTVDVTVRRLREKIEENPASPKYILTRRGVGYYFAV